MLYLEEPIRIVEGFSKMREAQRFDSVNHDIRQNRMKQQQLMAIVMPGQEFFTNVSLVLILAVGAWRVMNGSMSLGTLVAFQSYVMTMWMPVRWIGMINWRSFRITVRRLSRSPLRALIF